MWNIDEIIQRLNTLTNNWNSLVANSKKIFQLPPSTSGVKYVAAYNETSTETEKFNLSDALDGMYSLTNGITAIGNIVRDGADFTFEVGFEWKINGIEYANAEITRTINDAGTGNHRIDIAVCDENNDIFIIEGTEVALATAVVQPPVQPNTLFLCSFLITESVIGDNTIPEIVGQDNIPLRVEIESTDLDTNDIAGFVDYINALNPALTVLETNSLVQYYLTDTGDVYQFSNVGKGVYGLSNTQITSSNVLKFSLSQNLQDLESVLTEGATATDKLIELNSASSDDVILIDGLSQTMGVINTLTGAIAAIKSTFVEVTLGGEGIRILKDKIRRTIGGFYSDLVFTNPTANRTITFKDESGTVAYLNDIPTSSAMPHATASGTDTYTATITGVASYADGDAYIIRFTNGNTTGCTLNINSLGAVSLYRNNDGALLGGDIVAGGDMICVYDSVSSVFRVIGTSPNSLYDYVTNDDSVTLTKGMPVYAFSGTGDRITVKRANNTGDATSAQTVGLVLSSSIASGQKGIIMVQGLLDGLSTLPTSTFADGDAVYLGDTDGSITNVKPSAPNHLVYLGVVTTASNGSAGRMYVRVQNGYELQELHNVALTSPPTNNDVLTYETATSLWKNKSLGTILGYTPFRFIQTSQTPHTGTTSETVIATATINGSTFNTSDVAKTLFGINKTGTLGTYSLRLKINTTNNPATATQIALFTSAGTSAQMAIMSRSFSLNGGNLYGYSFSGNLISDITSVGGALSSTPYNTANTLYFFWTVQLAQAGDSITPNLTLLTN